MQSQDLKNMEQFLNIFFFLDKNTLIEAGKVWGIDMACLCALPNFFNLILHFIIGGFIISFIIKYSARRDMFFLLLLVGIVFSGFSKFIDWTTNMLTATGNTVFFSYPLDIMIEAFQFVGIGVILYAVFKRFSESKLQKS